MFCPFLDRNHFLNCVFFPSVARRKQHLSDPVLAQGPVKAQPVVNIPSVQVLVCTEHCTPQSGQPLSLHCKSRKATSLLSPTDTEMCFLKFFSSLATVLASKECSLHLFLLKLCERALGSYGSVQGTKSSFILLFLLSALCSCESKSRT